VRTLLLAAGGGDAFVEAGFPFPKNLVEIDGLPLLQRVIEGLGALALDGRLLVAIRRDENNRYHTGRMVYLIEPSAQVIDVGDSSGAACTAMLAADHILLEQPLLVVNGDQYIAEDLSSIVMGFAEAELDGGVVVFDGVHPRWSYVRTDTEGFVIEASEKRPISRLATAGFYWFARGGDFLESSKQMILKDAHVNDQFFVCPTMNEMVLSGAKVGIHSIERSHYFSLRDPQSVAQFEGRFMSSLEEG
jgi:dTDP-glucose pyrophosphorylase